MFILVGSSGCSDIHSGDRLNCASRPIGCFGSPEVECDGAPAPKH